MHDETHTLSSLSKYLASLLRRTFCAAVNNPFSGVHSFAVRITAPSSSIGLSPSLLPTLLHSFNINFCTPWSRHKRPSGAVKPTPGNHRLRRGMTWRKFTSWGVMIATGCLACAEAYTQMLATKLHDL